MADKRPSQILFILFLGTPTINELSKGRQSAFLFYLFIYLFKDFYLFTHERHREAETQAEGEAGSMHREPDVGLDPGSPESRPGPKAGTKLLRHPRIPVFLFLNPLCFVMCCKQPDKCLWNQQEASSRWDPPTPINSYSTIIIQIFYVFIFIFMSSANVC